MFKILFIDSSYASAKISVILDFPWTSRILIKCLPFIDMHMVESMTSPIVITNAREKVRSSMLIKCLVSA